MDKPRRSKLAPVLFVVFGILMLLFGLVMNSLLNGLFKPPKWPYVLNLSPGVLLICTALVVNKIGRRRSAAIFTSWIVALVLFAGLLFINGGLGWDLSARPETDPADYQDILRVLGYPERDWLRHFPKSIPPDTSDVRVHWGKGYLQATMFLQLRFVLPEEQIKSLLSDSVDKQAKVPYRKGDSSSELPPFMPFSAGESEYIMNWPKDFSIIVFHYGEYGTYPEEGYWDKGFSYGVAISTERNEIVYWTEEYPY